MVQEELGKLKEEKIYLLKNNDRWPFDEKRGPVKIHVPLWKSCESKPRRDGKEEEPVEIGGRATEVEKQLASRFDGRLG